MYVSKKKEKGQRFRKEAFYKSVNMNKINYSTKCVCFFASLLSFNFFTKPLKQSSFLKDLDHFRKVIINVFCFLFMLFVEMQIF